MIASRLREGPRNVFSWVYIHIYGSFGDDAGIPLADRRRTPNRRWGARWRETGGAGASPWILVSLDGCARTAATHCASSESSPSPTNSSATPPALVRAFPLITIFSRMASGLSQRISSLPLFRSLYIFRFPMGSFFFCRKHLIARKSSISSLWAWPISWFYVFNCSVFSFISEFWCPAFFPARIPLLVLHGLISSKTVSVRLLTKLSPFGRDAGVLSSG